MYLEKTLRNRRLREVCKKHRMYLWELADLLGITEVTLSRKLRRELTEDEQNDLIRIVEEAANNGKV